MILRLIPLWIVLFSQADNDVVKDLLLLEKEFESEAQRLSELASKIKRTRLQADTKRQCPQGQKFECQCVQKVNDESEIQVNRNELFDILDDAGKFVIDNWDDVEIGDDVEIIDAPSEPSVPASMGKRQKTMRGIFSVLDKDKSGTLKFSEFADLILARDRFRKKENTQPTVKLASGGIGSHGILGERKDIDAYLDDELLDMVGLGRSPQLSKFKSPVRPAKETAQTLP